METTENMNQQLKNAERENQVMDFTTIVKFSDLFKYFIKLGLKAKDLGVLRRVSRLFKELFSQDFVLRESIIEAIENPEQLENVLQKLQLSDVQKQYFTSDGGKTRIQKEKGFSVTAAIQDLKRFENVGGQNKSNLIMAGIKLGYLPQEIKFKWFSEIHCEALKHGISFKEIKGLTEYQVKAMLTLNLVKKEVNSTTITTNSEKKSEFELVPNISRKDVEGGILTQMHIEALQKEMPLALIKNFTELQVKGLLVGFSETDVKSFWFTNTHITVIETGMFTVEEIRGLDTQQMQLLEYGIPREEILKVKNGDFGFCPAIEALKKGYKWEVIRELNSKQISFLFTLEGFNSLFTLADVKHENFSYHTVRVVNMGYKISEVLELSENAQNAIVQHGLTLEQVKKYGFSFKVNQAAYRLNVPYEQLVKELKGHQLNALCTENVWGEILTIEQAKKFSTPLHSMAFANSSFRYKEILKMDAKQLSERLKIEDLQKDMDLEISSVNNNTSTVEKEVAPTSPLVFSTQAQKVEDNQSKSAQATGKNTRELELELAIFQAERESELELSKRNNSINQKK